MTLVEALSSGKKMRRVSLEGEYLTYDEYMEELGLEREDILATDWELEPVAAKTVTAADIAAAWNAARTGTTAIKAAGQTEFYKRFEKLLVG